VKFNKAQQTDEKMEDIKKIKSHWAWIVSLLTIALFYVALYLTVAFLWDSYNNILGLFIDWTLGLASPTGTCAAGYFLFRNRRLMPLRKRIIVVVFGCFLLIGNLTFTSASVHCIDMIFDTSFSEYFDPIYEFFFNPIWKFFRNFCQQILFRLG
jgi:hypothetical protein